MAQEILRLKKKAVSAEESVAPDTPVEVPSKATKTRAKTKEAISSVNPVDDSPSEDTPIAPAAKGSKKNKSTKKTKGKAEPEPSVDVVVESSTSVEIPLESAIPLEVSPSPEPEQVVVTEAPPEKPKESISQISSESPEKDNKKEQVEAKPIFQAIGLVYGTVHQLGEEKFLEIEGKRYPIHGWQRRYKPYRGIDNSEKHYFKVYPSWHRKKGEDGNYYYEFGFSLVGIIKKPGPIKVNNFILKGIWQISKFTGEPILLIYRNTKKNIGDLCRPLNAYIIWENPSVEPWTFVAKEDSETKTVEKNKKEQKKQLKRYFCQVKAEFNPETGKLTVIEELDKPTTVIPCYISPRAAKKAKQRQKAAENIMDTPNPALETTQ
jgi:hypothetical protein